ncbi:A disintegrin and metalloproteinase with thrombospondin motifs 18-like isoform X2 [Mercenaria mercenaria]|uniref:A disintegrin and metalloproteinase with thrombospondin motifs 18-like isoform X2 n=1 Tax=Mercenaria mercenaria TaxID=6596 RepID=UPI00234F584C|nr:A disintegrin and metalloproteinase with thrombospondin motifs 18-like isoform X2 [Mercenaria mercenaria]
MFATVIAFISLASAATVTAQDRPQFHKELTSEERKHYFGTELITEVPHYEYTTPQLIDRRRKRRSGAADDTLEYVIEAFGDATHLILEKNKDLISPGCIVQHLKQNETRDVYPCATDEINCFYTGRSSNHSNAWVAASVCGGFQAVIGLPEKTLVVQPIKERHKSRARRDTLLADPHIAYLYQTHDSSCSVEDEGSAATYSRKRRSTGKKYVETTVVVDPTSYRFHGSETEKMVKTVMNIAAQRFLDPSLQSQLYFTLTKIMILEHNEAGLNIEPDSGLTLDSFCDWQSGWNPTDDSNPQHADYVALITKVDLVHRGNTANTGLARKGMCGAKTRCSVNEDSGLGTGITLAHETGHVLGMSHDSDGNSCLNGKNIMSSMAPSGPDALQWSSCSAGVLKSFLSSSESNCLNDAPPSSAEKLYSATSKPGSIYTVNKQCKLMLGKDAEVCEGVHSDGQDVCGAIVCRPRHDTGVNGCVIYSTPRMDGTDCGNRKWCIGGRCVAMGPGSPGPVNGGWSEWESTFSECSRSCGGGVKVKQRFCNNPEPMYGGRQCSGPSSRAEVCNMQECTASQYDFQAQQCAATDGNSIGGKRYHWIPNTDSIGDDGCKINCQADGTNYFAKRGISKDGTQCTKDSPAPFTKCVKGSCKAFGCDGHMDSGHVYDQCGLCNGKGNTCKKVSGTFQGGKAKVFTTFVKIPKGSTGITITQGNMYCYLSIVVSGKHLFTETTPHLSGTYNRGGVVIKYQSKPERIEIIGPINTDIEAQVYRKYGPPYVGVDPDVYYEYHIPTTAQTVSYLWKTKTGHCSKTCGTGEQSPIITCESSVSGTVDDFNCNIHDKPAEVKHPCNTHACPPRWRATQWARCSKSCGGGQHDRSVDCVEENNNVEKVLSAGRCHGQSKPVASSTCNTDACPGVWKTGAWSACSDTCGQGLKTRTVKCYGSASSNTPVSDSVCLAGDKPSSQDYCVVKPCRTDISGSKCKDKVDNCFGSYGDAVCTGSYKSWARDNCMKSCGVCAVNPSDFDPNCKDEVDNCNQYTTGFCTSGAYVSWAKSHCKKFCGYCGGEAVTTKAPAVSAADCLDTDNCAAHGKSVCTEYASWSKTHCKKFCNLCELSANSGCIDQEDNCAAYGSGMCTSYKPWAKSHCQNFCGLCNSRKKREADGSGPPPLIEGAILKPVVHEEDMLTNELLAVENGGIYDDDDDYVISGLNEEENKIPHLPLCSTVRTEVSGQLDILGKLLPGFLCEQVIALPLDSRVLLKFTDFNVDCDMGDELTVVDVVRNEEIKLCSSIEQNEWLSAGNIVAVKFTPAANGHGIAYTYEAFPQNKSISACNQIFTSAVGEISSVKYPAGAKHADDTCEIFIAGTPGKSIEMTFHQFGMKAEGNESCLRIKDIDADDEDVFCGELSPFIWESRGSNVRLVYEQSFGNKGFDASYTVKDL